MTDFDYTIEQHSTPVLHRKFGSRVTPQVEPFPGEASQEHTDNSQILQSSPSHATLPLSDVSLEVSWTADNQTLPEVAARNPDDIEMIPRPSELTNRCMPDWSRELLGEIKARLRTLVEELLDKGKPLDTQDQDTLKLIRKQLADEFPVLTTCEDLWPVDVMLRRRLEETTTSARTTHYYKYELMQRSQGKKGNRKGVEKTSNANTL
ncbi:hypothetical protein VKT23_015132 [Stygiomarasmius scandens]|uniref:Uncharacterized protein n=1 Tax=Marasmiellus scandens TaxID=2682957 RepID=A0ABR1J1Z4_9AGAR